MQIPMETYSTSDFPGGPVNPLPTPLLDLPMAFILAFRADPYHLAQDSVPPSTSCTSTLKVHTGKYE